MMVVDQMLPLLIEHEFILSIILLSHYCHIILLIVSIVGHSILKIVL